MSEPLVAKHSTKTLTNIWHLSVWPRVKLSHLGMQTFAKIWLQQRLMRLQAWWFRDVQNFEVDLGDHTISNKCSYSPQCFMCSGLYYTLKLHFRLHWRSRQWWLNEECTITLFVKRQMFVYHDCGCQYRQTLFWSPDDAVVAIQGGLDRQKLVSTKSEMRQFKGHVLKKERVKIYISVCGSKNRFLGHTKAQCKNGLDTNKEK